MSEDWDTRGREQRGSAVGDDRGRHHFRPLFWWWWEGGEKKKKNRRYKAEEKEEEEEEEEACSSRLKSMFPCSYLSVLFFNGTNSNLNGVRCFGISISTEERNRTYKRGPHHGPRPLSRGKKGDLQLTNRFTTR